MDDLKNRAGEKLEALHIAAVTAADNGKSRVQDAYNNTTEVIRKIQEIFSEIWQHELVVESRARAAAWARAAVQRVKDGAPPLSPVLLYEEIRALLQDRVWRRSVCIFCVGCALGTGVGMWAGMRAAATVNSSPRSRALHAAGDQVMLVEDALAPAAGPGAVLVRVQAFSVCPRDRGVLRGRGGGLRALLGGGALAVGRGLAGVVLDVGRGVTELEMGDEVWGCVSEWEGGAAAELLTLRSSHVCRRPPGLGPERAAAAPSAGATALSALRRLGLTPHNCKGKRVAVSGAGSGEGCALVQLLSAWGARVTAAAGPTAAKALPTLGAHEVVEDSNHHSPNWNALESHVVRTGPFDAIITCTGAAVGKDCHRGLLKSSAPRGAALDIRPRALLSDRLPGPLYAVFTVSFYTYRMLRWLTGYGSDTDWLEDPQRLSPGLRELARLVDAGQVAPVLDRIYLPQEFEDALAHACSDEAVGTTVIRFP